MHADRFEERLLAAILGDFPELCGTGDQPRAYTRRTPRRGRPEGWRLSRSVIVGGAAAAAAAALGVAGVLVLTGPGTPAHPDARFRLLSAQTVAHHVTAALNANRAVIYDLSHVPNSQTGQPEATASWTAGTPARNTTLTQNLGADGEPAVGYLVTVSPHTTKTITIDYTARTWSQTIYGFGSATPPDTPAPLPDPPAKQAAQLRNAIKAGTVKVAGPATVDGQRAIQLLQGSPAAGELDMWVSPTTYLPIRTIETGPGVSQHSSQAIRDDYEWLPGTAANLKLLTPAGAIPAGFTQVP